MMVRLIVNIWVCLCLSIILTGMGGHAAQAQDDRFFVELASDHIDVTTGFTGSDIKLFGFRKDKDAEVAIVIRGPEKSITVWRKAKIMGTWINRYSAVYKRMPLFYDYALGKSEEDMGHVPALFRENRIAVSSLFPEGGSGEKQVFQDALIRQKQENELYPLVARNVEFLNENFFRVDFHIPAAAPTGKYTIESFLIKNGKVKETDKETLKVAQVGLNAFIYRSARDHAIFYGFACIILALGAGWFVSVIQLRA